MKKEAKLRAEKETREAEEREVRQHNEAERHRKRFAYMGHLKDAFADGKLTDEERARLGVLQEGLPTEDRAWAALKAYECLAAKATADRELTEAEERELSEIQRALDLPDSRIAHHLKEFTRLKLVAMIRAGNYPVRSNHGLNLQKSELCYWVEPSSAFFEERVVRREFVGSSSGISVRICKGLTYRMGSFRGQPIVETGMVQVDVGKLGITNKRLIFSGGNKSVAIPWRKVIEVIPRGNGLEVRRESASGKPLSFTVEDVDLLCSMVAEILTLDDKGK